MKRHRWWLWAGGLVAAGSVLAGCDGAPHDLTVTTTVDGADADPGDGVCEVTVGAGDCSLRAALDEADASRGPDDVVTIHLPAGTYVLSVPGADDDNVGGDLDVTGDGELRLTGEAPGAVIDAAGQDAGIDVRAGTVVLSDVAVRGALGDGVAVRAGATASVARASLHGNGGAGLAVDGGGTANVLNATSSSNAAGGIRVDGALAMDYVTVTANGGGGLTGSSAPTVGLSVIADQASGPDCATQVASQGWNLDGDGSCGLTDTSDIAGGTADLAALSAHPLPHHRPEPGSDALDSVPTSSGECGVPFRRRDQRSLVRPAGGACDRGAIEVQDGWVVDTEADGRDAAPGDGTCATAADACSLRAAVDESNAVAGPDTVVVAPGIDPTLTLWGIDDSNAAGDLDVQGDLTLVGNGATITQTVQDRVLHVRAASTAVDGVTMTGGTTGGAGGAVLHATGDLSLTNSRLTSNRASWGGGLSASSTGTTTVRTSLIDHNVVTRQGGSACLGGFGGGIYLDGGTSSDPGRLEVTSSTISDNDAVRGGGLHTGDVAQYLEPSTCTTWVHVGPRQIHASAELRATTVAGNTAGGLVRETQTVLNVYTGQLFTATGGSITVAGTALANPDGDCAGVTPGSGGHNVSRDDTCGLGGAGDVGSTDPLLAPLADRGGPTPVRMPYANSPVLDAIAAGTAGLCDASLPIDQRGQPRPAGAGCDVGAVEGAWNLTAAPLVLVVDDAGDGGDVAPGEGTCRTASGTCTLRAAIDEANAWPLTDTVVIGPGVQPVLSVPGAGEDRNASGDLDVRADLVLDGDGAAVDAAGLDRVLHSVAGTVEVRDVTLTGGSADKGGGVRTATHTSLVGVTVEGNAATDVGGGVWHSADGLVLEASTVAANQATRAGGGVESTGMALEVTGSSVVGNTVTDAVDDPAGTPGGGGGIRRQASYYPALPFFGSIQAGTTISTSTIADNTATSSTTAPRGGGLLSLSSATTVSRSTFSGNTAEGASAGGQGGAVYAGVGGLTITSSTLHGNRAEGPGASGGAVRSQLSTSWTLEASTVAGNSAPGTAGIHDGDGTTNVVLSLLDDGTTSCSGVIFSGGFNVAAGTSCALGATGDRQGIDIDLGPLADNGGPTATALVSSAASPAIDAAPVGLGSWCTGTAIDQRGDTRGADGVCDIGAVEGHGGVVVPPVVLVVDHDGDDVDAVPGDGVCQDAAGAPGSCSLRAAIGESNARPGLDQIVIDDGVDPLLSLAGPDEDANATGDLDVTDHLRVDGGGATVDAAGLDRVLDVGPGLLVVVEDVTLTGGHSTGAGGGVRVPAQSAARLDSAVIEANTSTGGAGGVHALGPLEVVDSALVANHSTAANAAGGLVAGGNTTVLRSTIAGNSATAGSSGGGVLTNAATTIRDSTVSANSAPSGAGLRVNHASGLVTALERSTVADNAASPLVGFGGGIYAPAGSVRLTLVTVAGNTARYGPALAGYGFRLRGTAIVAVGEDCDDPVTSDGYNVVSDLSCAGGHATDVVANPMLAPLGDHGGSTATRPATAGSPVLDAIPAGTAGLCDGTHPQDQRGEARPEGPACDAGAVEGDPAPALVPLSLVVDHPADFRDASAGDGVCADAFGRCTLRAAITEANLAPTPDTIEIAPGVDPVLSRPSSSDEDANDAGDLDITDRLTVHGGGASIDGAGAERVLEVLGVDVTLDALTVTGGAAGGIVATGPLTLTGSTVTANGGVGVVGGTLDVRASTISYNTGTGISGADVQITSSTISDNGGDAVLGSANGRLRVLASTLAGNSRGLVMSTSVDARVSASVIDEIGLACTVAVDGGTHNVVADGSCGLSDPTNLEGASALLVALADNGGPTPTRLPYANSPAVDRVPPGTAGLCDATLPTDQRGVARPAGAGCDAGAVEGTTGVDADPLVLIVDTADDAGDAAPGDGSCDDGTGRCTLRAAVDESNTWPAPDEIHLAPGIDPVLSLVGAAEDDNATGDLDVVDEVVIDGDGGTIDGAGLDRVLHVRADTELTDVTITGGSSSGGAGVRAQAHLDLVDAVLDGNAVGGGLYVHQASADVERSTISANTSTAQGGGIYALHSTVTVSDSTLAGNTADSSGGGLYSTGGTLTVRRSLVTDNVAGSDGGGLWTQSVVEVSASTLDANRARSGGGALFGSGTVAVAASTVTDNEAIVAGDGLSTTTTPTLRGTVLDNPGTNCSGAMASGGHNVATDASCALTGTGDQPSTVTLLAPLADNGGPTPTRLPYANSPLVDAVPPGTAGLCDGSVPTDQRGVARPVGAGCDVGAVEGAGPPITPLTLVVDSALDADDAAPGDGACDVGDGTCTLRAAVSEANARITADTVTIAPGIDPVLSLAGTDEDVNATGDLDVTDDLVLDGAGATVDAAGVDRVLDVATVAATVTVTDVTLTGGAAAGGGGLRLRDGLVELDRVAVRANTSVGGTTGGGGVLVLGGQLDALETTIADNTASHTTSPARGGGLYSTGTGTVTLRRSTVASNTATSPSPHGAHGGGLHTSGGTLVLESSTIAANRATGSYGTVGGGAYLASGTATLRLTTVAGNTAVFAAGLHEASATVTLSGSLLEGAGKTCQGTYTSGGHNAAADTTCALAGTGDVQGVTLGLGALADNGGPTPTMLPAPGSPAIDAIAPGTPGLCDATVPTDQRGTPRPTGAACDRGALEQ